jgi:hypothetical protein
VLEGPGRVAAHPTIFNVLVHCCRNQAVANCLLRVSGPSEVCEVRTSVARDLAKSRITLRARLSCAGDVEALPAHLQHGHVLGPALGDGELSCYLLGGASALARNRLSGVARCSAARRARTAAIRPWRGTGFLGSRAARPRDERGPRLFVLGCGLLLGGHRARFGGYVALVGGDSYRFQLCLGGGGVGHLRRQRHLRWHDRSRRHETLPEVRC